MDDVQPPPEAAAQHSKRHALGEEHGQRAGGCQRRGACATIRVATVQITSADGEQRARLIAQPRDAERHATQHRSTLARRLSCRRSRSAVTSRSSEIAQQLATGTVGTSWVE